MCLKLSVGDSPFGISNFSKWKLRDMLSPNNRTCFKIYQISKDINGKKYLLSPVFKTIAIVDSQGYITSDREHPSLTYKEVMNGEINNGLHVFDSRIYAKSYFGGLGFWESEYSLFKVYGNKQDYIGSDYQYEQLCFHKIRLDKTYKEFYNTKLQETNVIFSKKGDNLIFNKKGQLHSEHSPAIVSSDTSYMAWYQNGNLKSYKRESKKLQMDLRKDI